MKSQLLSECNHSHHIHMAGMFMLTILCIWIESTSLKITKVNHFKGHTNWIYDTKYSPDGTKFATASDDDSVIIWDAAV